MATPPRQQDVDLALYIVEFLERRNAAELAPAFGAMTVADRRFMLDELAHVLLHGGHPPNWVKR